MTSPVLCDHGYIKNQRVCPMCLKSEVLLLEKIVPSDSLLRSLRKIVLVYLEDEERHFQENPTDSHVFHDLVAVRKFLAEKANGYCSPNLG